MVQDSLCSRDDIPATQASSTEAEIEWDYNVAWKNCFELNDIIELRNTASSMDETDRANWYADECRENKAVPYCLRRKLDGKLWGSIQKGGKTTSFEEPAHGDCRLNDGAVVLR